jgi:cytochrome c5
MNIQKGVAILTVAGLAILAAGTGPSAKGPNPFHGKTLYKATCRLCHGKGGEAKLLTPMSKTQAQWENFFKAKVQGCMKRVEAKTGKAPGAEDIADMKFFLVSHAADSDQPETCGE